MRVACRFPEVPVAHVTGLFNNVAIASRCKRNVITNDPATVPRGNGNVIWNKNVHLHAPLF